MDLDNIKNMEDYKESVYKQQISRLERKVQKLRSTVETIQLRVTGNKDKNDDIRHLCLMVLRDTEL